MDLVLQGDCNNYTLDVAHHYLQLEFVNNIIISCWENSNKFVISLNIFYLICLKINDAISYSFIFKKLSYMSKY